MTRQPTHEKKKQRPGWKTTKQPTQTKRRQLGWTQTMPMLTKSDRRSWLPWEREPKTTTRSSYQQQSWWPWVQPG